MKIENIKMLFFSILFVSMVVLTAQEVDDMENSSLFNRSSFFPHVTGSNLYGHKFNLPGDFQGELNITLVAFWRHQQKDVDTWLPMARRLKSDHENVAYYELPTIRQLNSLSQWYINNGMRMGIPDTEARLTTITLYLDKEMFCEALDISVQDSIHVFLVNKEGDVLWRESGRHSLEKENELMAAIESAAVAPKELTFEIFDD